MIDIWSISCEPVLWWMPKDLLKISQHGSVTKPLLPPMGLLPDTQNRVLHMRRECRERFPRHRLQRKSLISDPNMHHGTCVTHVPWCMSGSLTKGGGEKFPAFPAHAQHAILRIWQEAHGGDSSKFFSFNMCSRASLCAVNHTCASTPVWSRWWPIRFIATQTCSWTINYVRSYSTDRTYEPVLANCTRMKQWTFRWLISHDIAQK